MIGVAALVLLLGAQAGIGQAPSWTKAAWTEDSTQYRKVRQQIEVDVAKSPALASKGIRPAFEAFQRMHRPIDLFKAALLQDLCSEKLGAASPRPVDWRSFESIAMPKNFEFARARFLYGCGWRWDIRPFGERILKVNPSDRAVVSALALDYIHWKPNRNLDRAVELAESLLKIGDPGYNDYYVVGLAHHMQLALGYSRSHAERALWAYDSFMKLAPKDDARRTFKPQETRWIKNQVASHG